MMTPTSVDARLPLRPWLVALLIGLIALIVLIGALVPGEHVAQAVSTTPADNRPLDLTPRVYAPAVLRFSDQTIPPFGVQMYSYLNATNGLTRVVDLRAAWVRVPLLWDTIEPVNTTPDHYDWAALDASLQNARNENLHIILMMANNPGWAAARTNGPVTNTVNLQEFLGAAVARYPDIIYWEMYNEPDDPVRFGNDTVFYANMLKALYPVIKAANSNAQVVFGGIALDFFPEDGGHFNKTFLQEVLTACSAPCFDVANFHYYPAFRKRWEPYGRDMIGKTNYVRQVLAQHGYVRPVINTETGWPAIDAMGGTEVMARWVPKAFVRTVAAGLPFAIWYALTDADTSYPGLLDGTMTPRPAYNAFRTMTSVLGLKRLVRAIPSSETGSANIEGYQYQNLASVNAQRMDVYWYDCPSMYSYSVLPADCNTTASLRIAASRVTKIDKFGVSTVVNDAADGRTDGIVTLTVSSSPIYIDYTP